MNTFDAFVIIAVAALIHASFQLSVSVLVLLSGHAIGSRRSHTNLLRLIGGFISGAGVMTLLLLSFTSLVLLALLGNMVPSLAWVIACGLLIGLGVAVWAFYYRRETGTTLWLPRGFVRYLTERTKATSHSAEAFGLGLSSIAAEVLFILAPVLVTSLVLIQLSPDLQLLGIGVYGLISLFPLFIVAAMVGGGHKLSKIQKWREANKHFLQFAAGSGLIILGFYVYVEQVMGSVLLAHGGL